MMPVKNKKIIIFFLVNLFLVFSCSHENLILYGKVFLEDPSSSSTDNTFDYQEGDSRITIRSGNISTTADSDGSFRLVGDTIEGHTILFEASRPGYQTAYVKAYIENIDSLDIYKTLQIVGKTLELIGNIIAIFSSDDEEVVEEDYEELEDDEEVVEEDDEVVEDDGPDAYDLETPIEDSIELKSRRRVQFNNTTPYRYDIDDLEDSEDEIYIFLLKEATSRDWNVFEYAD